MKVFALISIVILVLVFSMAQADDKCRHDGKTFNKGETYQPPGKCELFECFGEHGMIAKSCPAIDSLKPCKYIAQDPTKPYPRCCAHQKC